MKIRKDFEIAINALTALKGHYEPVRTEDLAVTINASPNFLEQVMRKLRLGGFVASTRGPNGGYTLCKNEPNAFEVAKSLGLVKQSKAAVDVNSPQGRLQKAVQEAYLSTRI